MTPDQTARHLLRALLDGTPLPADATPAACGPWAGVAQALLQAHAQGGQPAVQRAFIALARQDPALVALAAGDDARCQDRLERGRTLRHRLPAAPLRRARPAARRAGDPGRAPQAGQVLAGAANRHRRGQRRGRCWGPRSRPARCSIWRWRTPRAGSRTAWPGKASAAAPVTFHTQWAPLSHEGLADLMMACAQGYRLVVVDTLSRGMGRADPLDAVDMVLLLGGLQRLAARYDLALLLIDHHRKPAASVGDAVDDIWGQHGQSGGGGRRPWSLQTARRAGGGAQGDGARTSSRENWRCAGRPSAASGRCRARRRRWSARRASRRSWTP